MSRHTLTRGRSLRAALVAALAASALACGDAASNKTQTAAAGKSAAAARSGGAAKASPSAAAPADLDKIKVPASYEEQAQKDVTADNVDEKVDALENEILAESKH